MLVGRDPHCGSSIEPISLLDKIPGDPSLLVVEPLNTSRIQHLAETFGSEQKVRNVIQEFTSLPRCEMSNAIHIVQPKLYSIT